MNSATLSRDALIPHSPDGMGRGLALALAVHVLLIVALAFGVSWRSSNPAGVEAELWAAVPQIGAPRAVAPEPPPPQPVAKPVPPPPPQPKVETPSKQDDAQIAIEKAKREETKRKEEQQRRDEELKRQKEEQQRKQAEAEKAQQEKAKKAQAQAEQKQREAQTAAAEAARKDQLRRISELAGDGPANSTGTAARTAGPSANYAGRIKARILPNIILTDTVSGNPQATVEVRAAPDGTIIGRRLTRSSGVPAWDDAVLRAIDKTEVLPRDTDGRVPSSIVIDFRPRD